MRKNFRKFNGVVCLTETIYNITDLRKKANSKLQFMLPILVSQKCQQWMLSKGSDCKRFK